MPCHVTWFDGRDVGSFQKEGKVKLLTDKPLDEYFKKIKRREIEVLTIASPFITGPGVRYISNYAKSKLVRVRVLTNLSKFNLLRSLDNPIRPLVELSESLGENLEIKSSPKLHAKLFLADASVALHGSSNLTLGGGESNHELNMLVLGGRFGLTSILWSLRVGLTPSGRRLHSWTKKS